jgi:hypothetical protein
MSYPINYPTPQGANIQIFNVGGATSDWVKPQGASFVWFTLIGGGGNGNGAAGGGSGAVTNCMVPAFLIPDVLRVNVSTGNGVNTTIVYQQKDGTGYTLLTANGATTTTGGTASTSNYFSCMGFFQSVAGATGSNSDIPTASTTTFLSGGAASGAVIANYGYQTSSTNEPGSFRMQPIIVGSGGSGTTSNPVPGGIGCGGGAASPSGVGGPGLVVIITW